jgi:hypothetical protein
MNTDRFDSLTRQLVDRDGSRRSLLRLAGALALPGLHALASPAARAAEVPDAQCPPQGNIYSYESLYLVQTFKAQHTGKLTRATVYAVAPSATNTDDYRIEIWTTNRKGKPKAGLVNTIVNNIARPAPGQTTEVTVNFVTPRASRRGSAMGWASPASAAASP